ncbi:MAG: hypothetical protein Q8K62_10630 [Thiobacillus sp.]|nr:hypothetical protein [Thiobacillus sp.]
MIVGTAGHIDHGKTTLVHALTGVDTDHLAAEKLRGISIELGSAYQPLAACSVSSTYPAMSASSTPCWLARRASTLPCWFFTTTACLLRANTQRAQVPRGHKYPEGTGAGIQWRALRAQFDWIPGQARNDEVLTASLGIEQSIR